MDIFHYLHKRGMPDYFYDAIPRFLGHYDRINYEWRGLLYTRPSFERPSSSHHPSLYVSHKRQREVYLSLQLSLQLFLSTNSVNE